MLGLEERNVFERLPVQQRSEFSGFHFCGSIANVGAGAIVAGTSLVGQATFAAIWNVL